MREAHSPLPTLIGGTLALLVLLFVVPRLGGPPSWSIFYLLHELPGEVMAAAVLLPAPLALLLHGPLRRALGDTGRSLAERVPHRVLPWLAGLAALIVFWTFRELRHWGDAEQTVAILEGRASVSALGLWFWREPLDRLLAMGATALAGRLLGWGAETAVAALSCAAGAVFAALLVPAARLLGRERPSRVFVWCFVLSMGASQLFFGHVENYTLITTALLAFFLLSARLLIRGSGGLWGAWLLAALALTVHAQGAFLIAPLIALVALVRGRLWRTPRDLVLSALPGLAYLLCFYAACRAMGAPGIEIGMNRYAGQAGVVLGIDQVLQGRHLWNVLHGYVLTVPFGAFVVLAGALAARERAAWRDAMVRVLAAACLSFGVFSLFFDAQLARRLDWSLFAPAALPVALLAARLFALRLDAGRARPVAATFLVLVSLALSVPWVASNHLAAPEQVTRGAERDGR